jgi:hypothetical protein
MEKPPPTPPLPDIPFVNEVRLSWKQWLITVALLISAVFAVPRIWKKVEQFQVASDYRIPYSLSKDYWLYERRLQNVSVTNILLVGDSVIWGEYVLPNGTLSHFLNEQTQPGRFINAGVNGLYPLAIEGLLTHYTSLRQRKVILHCNLLWMSSPKADLQDPKPQQVNHGRLLPQFRKIPSYRADANERLSVLVERNVQFMSWVNHLQIAYFDNKSVPAWTLQVDDSDPPRYPNAWKNPLSQITFRVPSPPANDPERGPASPRHRTWTQTGAAPTSFDWVNPTNSLQLRAFKRAVEKLRADGHDLFVVIGPFNTHIIAEESKAGFDGLRNDVILFLKASGIPHSTLETLPSEVYADASHPLTEGYKLLADQLMKDASFAQFIK